jgi:hypothetical protein
MTGLSMINYRKPRKITALSTFLSGLISLLLLAAMIFLGGMRLNLELGFPLFLAGLFLGYLRGTAVKLNWENDQVIGRNSILFLILWGLSLALSQMLGMLGSSLLASLGLIPVVFTTGLQAGYYGNLFLRRLIMGSEAKPRKGLQIVIGIVGGIGLFLITAFYFLILGPDVTDAFLRIGDRPQGQSIQEKAVSTEAQTATSEPSPALLPGQMPTSGNASISCDEEIERQKEYSLNGYNFGDNYTFEQAFLSYKINLDMELDFSNRIFSLQQHQIEEWSSIKWDQSDIYSILIVEARTDAEGILEEDGWIRGNYDYYSVNLDDPDDEPYRSSSGFYGYIDDQMEKVVVCTLNSSENNGEGKLNEFTADFNALRAAGKDKLIANWYHPFACYICEVDRINP